MPWLRNEDAALKNKLQGLKVYDGNAPENGRPVPVRYLLPQDELANLSYPIIIIQHGPMLPAKDREHRNIIKIPYSPENMPIWWNPDQVPLTIDPGQSPFFSYFPIPYDFYYTITLYSRFMTQHAQPLVAQMLTERYLPYHFGYLDVPQDGTHRSMFLEGGPTWDYEKDEDDKRLISVTFTVRVFSELLQDVQTFEQYGGTLVPVNAVNFDLSVYNSAEPIDLNKPAELKESFGFYSFGHLSQFNVQQEP